MSLILLAMFFAGCGANQIKDTTYVNVVGLGDSISAGYAPNGTDMTNYYNDYTSGKVPANQKSFTYLFGENISSQYVKVTTKSYAQSGDKTSDLVDKLNTTAVLNNLKKADIVTLCIGANNILSVALNNLTNYLNDDMTDQELTALLEGGVDDFKNDYTNTIIPILTRGNSKIFVMTIYDPYKYFDLNEAEVADSFSTLVASMGQKFNNFKAIVIEYLNQINDFIRSEKFDDVYVVDVNNAFEGLNKTDYAKYLNVDSEKLQIKSVLNLINISSNLYVDPHPTIEGQKFISDLFTDKLFEIAKACEENK